jgi:hypothetical protein
MGSKWMNLRLTSWSKDNFPRSKSDLFSIFIDRNIELSSANGFVAMITMQSWMFLPFFETFRTFLVDEFTIVTMAHLGARAFDTISGEVVSTTAFILKIKRDVEFKGAYLRLIDGQSEAEKNQMALSAISRHDPIWLFKASALDFQMIPTNPIAYWLSDDFRKTYNSSIPLGDIAKPCQGMATANNERFLRRWWETAIFDCNFSSRDAEEAKASNKSWFPYNKGGAYRKWYGNGEHVVLWKNNGEAIKSFSRAVIRNENYYFKPGLSWTAAGGSTFAIRMTPSGYLFDVKGSTCFSSEVSSNGYSVCFLVNTSLSFSMY